MFLFSNSVLIYGLILPAFVLFQIGDKKAPYRTSQHAVASSEAGPLSLVIWTDQAKYSLDAGMKVNAALQNEGDETMYIDRRIFWGGLGGGLKLGITNEHGKDLPARLALSDAPMPPPKEGDTSILIRLEPGYLYGTSVYLKVKDFFPKPGRYALRVAYGSSLLKETVAPELRNLPVLWAHSPIIVSEPVWITVTATANRMTR
jgi:hypothetical protein